MITGGTRQKPELSGLSWWLSIPGDMLRNITQSSDRLGEGRSIGPTVLDFLAWCPSLGPGQKRPSKEAEEFGF